MKTHSFLGLPFPFLIPRLAAIVLAALAWTSPAFCDKIHDTAKNGDLAKVKALLKRNPDLVFSKDNKGRTPLQTASLGHKEKKGRKDVAELLRQHGGHK